MKYRFDFHVDGFMSLEIEADSPEDAAEKALSQFEVQCSGLAISELSGLTVEVEQM